MLLLQQLAKQKGGVRGEGARSSRQSQASSGAARGGPSHYAQVKQSQAAGLARLGFIIVSATKELNSCQAHHQPG